MKFWILRPSRHSSTALIHLLIPPGGVGQVLQAEEAPLLEYFLYWLEAGVTGGDDAVGRVQVED